MVLNPCNTTITPTVSLNLSVLLLNFFLCLSRMTYVVNRTESCNRGFLIHHLSAQSQQHSHKKCSYLFQQQKLANFIKKQHFRRLFQLQQIVKFDSCVKNIPDLFFCFKFFLFFIELPLLFLNWQPNSLWIECFSKI